MEDRKWIEGDGTDEMQFVERASSKPRLWTWFDARLFDTSGGLAQKRVLPCHCVVLQVGAPINSLCRCDGFLQRRRATSGDIDIIPGTFSAVWEEDGPTTQLSMGLTPSLVSIAADEMGVDPDRISFAPQLQLRDPLIEHVGWAIKAELESNEPYDRLYAEGLGLSLTIHLLRHYGYRDSAARKGGLTRRQFQKIIEYINDHLAADLSLIELATVAGVSPSHFKSLFKQRLGLPVHKYIVKRRVEYAMELLVHGRVRLSDVALRAGFADQSHMARCMRRVVGMTPSAVLRNCG